MAEQAKMEVGFDTFVESLQSGGDEELLRVASAHARQYTSDQIKVLIFLGMLVKIYNYQGDDLTAELVQFVIDEFKELKRYNNSDRFVMRALDSISLRRLMNNDSINFQLKR